MQPRSGSAGGCRSTPTRCARCRRARAPRLTRRAPRPVQTCRRSAKLPESSSKCLHLQFGTRHPQISPTRTPPRCACGAVAWQQQTGACSVAATNGAPHFTAPTLTLVCLVPTMHTWPCTGSGATSRKMRATAHCTLSCSIERPARNTAGDPLNGAACSVQVKRRGFCSGRLCRYYAFFFLSWRLSSFFPLSPPPLSATYGDLESTRGGKPVRMRRRGAGTPQSLTSLMPLINARAGQCHR